MEKIQVIFLILFLLKYIQTTVSSLSTPQSSHRSTAPWFLLQKRAGLHETQLNRTKQDMVRQDKRQDSTMVGK